MSMIGENPGDARSERLRLRIARTLDWSIVLLTVAVVYFAAMTALVPHLQVPVDVSRINLDEGNAFTFAPGRRSHWPYVIPSHPDFPLSPGDVRVTEDGKPIGTLEPLHSTIRQLGNGLFNFWQGTIWFSTSDNTDPRTNGRSYTVLIKERLARSARMAKIVSTAALVVLILCRGGPILMRRLARATYRMRKRLAIASRSRAGLGLLARRGEACVAGVERLAARIPLTFARTFAIAGAVPLVVFVWQSLVRPMPLFFTADSFGYVLPGLELAAGPDAKGQSVRDVGYPALTLLATRLGSLSTIPVLQLLMVVAGLVCVLGVIFIALESLASRLHSLSRFPRTILALFAGLVAVGYCCLMLSHDLFVINIYSAMAEAPHLLPTALALLFFVSGWTASPPRRRVILLVMATVAAYLSIMIKPHTLIVLALCLASLLIVGLRNLRVFRSPLVVTLCVAAAGLVVAVHQFDAWITPPGNDFGPKTLFCNHLDVIGPTFDTSTPERARILPMLRGVLHNPERWAVMGYDGDLCFYNQPFTDAIIAAAKSEGRSVASWQMREFANGVAENPIAYGRDVAKQLAYFMIHTIDDITYTAKSHVSDWDWQRLQSYADTIRMSRDQFDVEVVNWVPTAYPALARVSKSVLQSISDSFAAVTVGSTAVALVMIVFFRNRMESRPETVLLATGAFTVAFAMTTALAHTFDVGRYLTDILPFSVLWWTVGAAYLAHGLILLSALAVRGNRRSAITGSAGFAAARDAQANG